MPNALKHILVIILFPVIFLSCISDVTINDDPGDKELVINCFLDTRKDTIFVQLGYSKPIQSTSHFEAVENAQIQLLENNIKVGDVLWDDSSMYILPFKVTSGKTYRLEAVVSTKRIWAETTVPPLMNASVEKTDSGNYSRDFRIALSDNGTENNFYWITATGYEGVEGNMSKNIACVLYSNFEYADDFNQSIYQNGSYKFEYKYYIRFTDSGLPGGETEIVFYPQCISNPIEVFLLSTDYHLDKYMKSSLLLQNMDLFAREMPIVYAPFPMYSNINGGTGIFGSYNSVSEKFEGK